MLIRTTCPRCHKDADIEVKQEDYVAWKQGKYIQDAFPYLDADQREMLMTGICKVCWDEMFKEEEE